MAVVYFSSPVKLEHGLYGFLGGQLNLWSRFSCSSYLSTGMHLCARKLTSTLNICPDQKVGDRAQWQEPWWYANHLFSRWRMSGGIGNRKPAVSQRVPWATGLPDCRQASEEGATGTKVPEAHFLTPSFPSKWWERSVRTEQRSEVGWEKEFIILAWEGLMSALLHCMSGTFLRVSLRLFSSKKLSLPWLMDISYGVFIALCSNYLWIYQLFKSMYMNFWRELPPRPTHPEISCIVSWT